jgi:hypothetical protein
MRKFGFGLSLGARSSKYAAGLASFVTLAESLPCGDSLPKLCTY